MRKLFVALTLGVLLMVTGPVQAGGTGVTVGEVSSITGNLPAATLNWGSVTFPVTVKTNAAKGYRLVVKATSLTNGIAVALSDVKITVQAPSGCWSTGNSAGRDRRTGEFGDVIYVTVSVWQPVGSPKVTLSYVFERFK